MIDFNKAVEIAQKYYQVKGKLNITKICRKVYSQRMLLLRPNAIE